MSGGDFKHRRGALSTSKHWGYVAILDGIIYKKFLINFIASTTLEICSAVVLFLFLIEF